MPSRRSQQAVPPLPASHSPAPTEPRACPCRCHTANALEWSASMRKCVSVAGLSPQPLSEIFTSASGPAVIVIVIVPDQDADALVVAGRDDVDVGLAAHAVAHDVFDVAPEIAFGVKPVAAELSQHPETVEHRFVDAVGGEIAKAVEIGLLVEHEGPGDGAFDLDVGASREFVGPDHALDDISAVQWPVAIAVLRMDPRRAGGTALGVRTRRSPPADG